MYQYDERYVRSAVVVRIVDGDTVDLDIDLGWGIHIQGKDARVRLFGIDTPETFGVKKDSEEYQKGMAAKARLAELIPAGSTVWLHSHKGRGKYGRFVVVLWNNPAMLGSVEASVNFALYSEGHAALYKDEPLVEAPNDEA